MLNYVRQAAVCNSVREFFSEKGIATEPGMSNAPSVHEVLRATSLFSHIEDDRILEEAVVEHLLDTLRAGEGRRLFPD